MNINAKDIISRLKEHFKVNSDEKLATLLDVSIHTIRAWKQRNSVDYKVIISKCYKCDLNWLLLGEDNTICNIDTDTEFINLLDELENLKKENLRLKVTIQSLQDSLLSGHSFQSMLDMSEKYQSKLS